MNCNCLYLSWQANFGICMYFDITGDITKKWKNYKSTQTLGRLLGEVISKQNYNSPCTLRKLFLLCQMIIPRTGYHLSKDKIMF